MGLKIGIYVCNAAIVKQIRQYLLDLGHDVVFVSRNEETFQSAYSNTRPSLVILGTDTADSGHQGLSIRAFLNANKVSVIDVFSSDKKSLDDMITPDPAGCLMQPFTKQQLKDQLELVGSKPSVSNGRLILFVNNQYLSFDLSSIKFIEAQRNYSLINHAGSSNPSRVRITLKELMPKLPKSFIQIHRSFIVNTLQISSIDKDYCRLKDGNRMTFGRFYKAQVLRYVSRRYKYDF